LTLAAFGDWKPNAPAFAGAAMPDYRAYIIGFDGHFNGFTPLICTDDAVAIEQAQMLVDGHDVELWQLDRLVIILKHKQD
jgi:hypothetical protein